MQHPRNLAEWQKAVERSLRAGTNGVQIAIAHSTDEAQVVRDEVDSYKALQPTAPVELNAQTSTYIDVNGNRRGRVILDFPDVTLSTTAQPLTVGLYELAAQDQSINPLPPFQSVATSEASSLSAMDFTPGSVWKFKARALSGNFVTPGLWSAEVQVTMLSDTTPPPAPSAPVVSVNLGTLKVEWDGMGAGSVVMPADFARIEVAFGLASSPTTVIDTMFTAGFIVVGKSSYNVAHYFRFRAIDSSGNISAWSAQGLGIPVPLVDADIIQSHIDAALVQITNIDTAAIKDGAILEAKLSNNAVTQAKLLNGAVSLLKLDTAANDKITQGITDAATAQGAANAANTAAGTAQGAANAAAAAANTAAQAARDAKVATIASDRDPNAAGKWLFTRIDLAAAPPSNNAPTLEYFASAIPSVQTQVADGTDIVKNVGSFYYGDLRTSVRMATAGTLTFTATHDDGGAIFVDGVEVYRRTTVGSAISFSIPLTVGWHILDFVWTENSGNDGWYSFSTTIGSQVAELMAPSTASGAMAQAITAKAAADAAQAKADSAFTNAGTALTNAGNAQTSADGKNNIYYMSAKPAGTGFADGDTVFIRTGVGAPITEQWKWIKTGPTTGSWNQETLGHQVIASLDLGKATVGELDGIYVKAKTLTADKLIVSRGANLHPDPQVEDPTGWGTVTGVTVDPANGRTGKGSILIATGSTQNGIYYGQAATLNPRRPRIVAGGTYRLGAWVFTSADAPVGSLQLYGRVYADTGTSNTLLFNVLGQEAYNKAIIPANTWTWLEGMVSVPATTSYLNFVTGVFKQTTFTTGTVRFSDMSIQQAMAGELIVDGTITGNKVAADAITARNIVVGDFANLAIGSDFEDATAVPWTLASLHTISTAQSKSGTSSLRLAPVADVAAPAKSTFTADLRVREGEQWSFRMFAYIDATFNGTANSKLRISDQTNTPVLGALIYNAITRSAWGSVPLELVVTVPTGATSLRVELWNDSTTGYAYIDDIQIRRMSEASLIQNLGVEKLTASTASMGQAVIDKLWTDVVRSKKITTDMLVVAGENMVWNGLGENGDNTSWSLWNFDAADKPPATFGSFDGGNVTTAKSLANGQPPIAVEENTSYVAEFWLKASVANSRTYVEFMEVGGTNPTPQYAVGNLVVPTVWTKYSVPVKTSVGQTGMYLRMFINHTNGSVTNATQKIAGVRFRKQFESNLIVNGGILAAHLSLTEDLWTPVLGAHKITATELNVTNVTADTGVLGNLRTNLLTTDWIKAVNIDATNGITSRHTITGATIQTSTSGARVVLDTSGMNGYSATGVNYLKADSSGITVTGTLSAKGVMDVTTNPAAISAVMGPVVVPGKFQTLPGLGFIKATSPNVLPAAVFSPDGGILRLNAGDATNSYSGGNMPSTIELTTDRKVKIYAFGGTDFSDVVGGPTPLSGVKSINDVPIAHRFGDYSATQTAVPSATSWGVGTPTVKTDQVGVLWYITDDAIVDWTTATDVAKFRDDGIYAIHWTMDLSGATNGRTFQSLESATAPVYIARSSWGTTEDHGSLSVSCVHINAGQSVTFKYFHTSSGTRTATHNIRIMRIG